MLLIAAATSFEIEPTINWLNANHPHKADILITGIGLMETSWSLATALYNNSYSLLIQAGIAGTFHKEIQPGTVCLVQDECVGDLGVEENGEFLSVAQLGLTDPNQFPWKNGRLSNNSEFLQHFDLPKLNSVTVNEISTSPAKLSYYHKKLGADIEAMEGAAFHYAALKKNIPFLQMRAISNVAGERNKEKWKMEAAIQLLNEHLISIITKYIS